MSLNIIKNGQKHKVNGYMPASYPSSRITNLDIPHLQDTVITNPQDGDVLMYDEETGKWINGEGVTFVATITVTYPEGSTCTCVGNGKTYTATTNPQTFTVKSAGTYTVTATDGTETDSKIVTITTSGQSENVTLSYVPEGSTVTPTDDIQTWLACAGITDKSYTTLNEVLADETTLATLMAYNNAVDYLRRSTTWCVDVNRYSRASAYLNSDGTVTTSSTWSISEYFPVLPGTSVVISKESGESLGSAPSACIYDSSKNYISGVQYNNNTSITLNIPSNGAYIRVSILTTTNWRITGAGICASPLAMHYIGINNYASDELLADSTWLTAITNSSYIDNVLNTKVPLMTSNNVPIGVVSADSEKTDFPAYKVFDGDNSTMWVYDSDKPVGSSESGQILYEFEEAVIIKAFSVYVSDSRFPITAYNLKASNNGTDFVSLYSGSSVSGIITINNTTAYKYYALNVTAINNATSGTYAIPRINTLQFYGRESIPAAITKKTFATATDAEINEMCKWSERGVINLENDCGWAVGQEHTFTLGAIATTGTFNGITWTVGEAQSSQSVTIVLTRKGGAERVSPVLNTDGTSRNTPAFEWDFKDCFGTKGYMNSTNTNTGSWGASARRSWCNSGLLQQMLSVLPKLCNLFKVITAKTYNGTENEVTNDYMALRAEKEIFGEVTRSNTTEAGALSQASYYETSANRVKKVSGTDNKWWERSPDNTYAAPFCIVNYNGTASNTSAEQPAGISPFGNIG